MGQPSYPPIWHDHPVYASRLDRWIKIAAAGAVLASGAAAAYAAPQSNVFETKAKHAILMDVGANLVLFEKDADTLSPPASMSKLMTMAVVFRELKAGRLKLDDELSLAAWMGASVLEILPCWREFPDPVALRSRVAGAGLAIHSAHGCWGGESIRAQRVDLGSLDGSAHRDSIDDLKRCVDWLEAAGGSKLVVHPGGLSNPEDFDARRIQQRSARD